MDGKPGGRKKKKLEDAALYWARGGTSYQDAINDLKNLGAPEEIIQELEDHQRGEDFEVWPENWQCLEIFLKLQTQWRTTQGVFVGLDYSAVKWIFDVYGVEDHKEMLDSLMIIEWSALTVMNKREDN